MLKRISETIKDKQEKKQNQKKKKNGEFLGMFLGTLGATLLENKIVWKGIIKDGKGTVKAGGSF